MSKQSQGSGLTVQEIYNSKSIPANAPISPRSQLAFEASGVLPETIVNRTLSDFGGKGVDKEVQQLRYDTYSELRNDFYRRAKRCYDDITKSQTKENDNTYTEKLNDEKKLHDQRLLEIDQKRQEKFQARQREEIQQMISYNLVLLKREQENEMKLELERQKEEKLKHQALMEQKRRSELERKKVMQTEMEMKRQEKIKKELERKRAEEERQQEMNRQLQEKEREYAIRKHQEYLDSINKKRKERLEETLQYQMKQYEEKKQTMEQREIEREQKLREQKEKEYKEKMEKKAIVDKRIRSNLKIANDIIEQKKRDYDTKLEKLELQKLILERQRAQEIRSSQTAQQHKEQKRKLVYVESQNIMEQRRKYVNEKLSSSEKRYQEKLAEIQRKLTLQKEKRSLMENVKRANIERMNREADFKNKLLLDKIDEENKKREEIKMEQTKLRQQTLYKSAQAMIQKERAKEAMMELNRTNKWDQADQVLDEIFSQSSSRNSTIKSRRSTIRSKRSQSSLPYINPNTLNSNKKNQKESFHSEDPYVRKNESHDSLIEPYDLN